MRRCGFFLNTTRTGSILLKANVRHALACRSWAFKSVERADKLKHVGHLLEQNQAGSDGIQEERMDVDSHNGFSAYAPLGSSKVVGNET
jgi:hypothetical protein